MAVEDGPPRRHEKSNGLKEPCSSAAQASPCSLGAALRRRRYRISHTPNPTSTRATVDAAARRLCIAFTISARCIHHLDGRLRVRRAVLRTFIPAHVQRPGRQLRRGYSSAAAPRRAMSKARISLFWHEPKRTGTLHLHYRRHRSALQQMLHINNFSTTASQLTSATVRHARRRAQEHPEPEHAAAEPSLARLLCQ